MKKKSMSAFKKKNKLGIILTLLLVIFSFSNISSAQRVSSENGEWNTNVLYLRMSESTLTSTSNTVQVFYDRVGSDTETRNVFLTILKSGTTTFGGNKTVTLTKDTPSKEVTFAGLDNSTEYLIQGTISTNTGTPTVLITSNLRFKTLEATTTDKEKEKKWWYAGTAIWIGPQTKQDCEETIKDENPKPVCTYFEGEAPVIIKPPSGPVISSNNGYSPLQQLPGVQTTIDTSTACAFGNYLNILIKIFIGICAVLAMIMIVVGGLEYMTTELGSGKESAKSKITNAIFGLLIALGAFALLNTINPQLLRACIDLPTATVSENDPVIKTSAADVARCTALSDGPCSTANLGNSCFGGKAENASKLCHIESNGIASTQSSTDKCASDGTIFSFGLFQINLLANSMYIKEATGVDCSGLFTRGDGSEIKGSNYIQHTNSGAYTYDCKLKAGSEAKYTQCKNLLLDGAQNILVACSLYKHGTGGNNFSPAWSGDKQVCPSAFQ